MAELITKQRSFKQMQKKQLSGIDQLLEYSEESKQPIHIMFGTSAGFCHTGTKHLSERICVNGMTGWQNAANLDWMMLTSEDDNEARSARAVRPGKQNLGTVFASTSLPLCPLPVSELNGKDCGNWLQPQIIFDQAETYGVTLRQVLWGKGRAPSFFPENMVPWESFSNPNQGQKNKDAFLEF